MTPEEFVEKWRRSELKERSAAQEHFIDLCRLLGEETPAEADPKGEWYTFERGASKTTGGEGWADVWKRHHFGWEYKGKRKDLDAAFVQLQQYAVALENPPLLVVCDMDRFRIHTNWTNTVSEVHEFALEGILDATNRDKLKWAMSAPEQLRPSLTRDALTAHAAEEFATLAQELRDQGHDPEIVAHFVNRMVFCMFAEDVDLLPNDMFTRILAHSVARPNDFVDFAGDLFGAMKDGGRIGLERVEWFNGGLFDDDTVLPLTREQILRTKTAADLEWGDIDPSIFGTLFERGLDPDKRSQLGAHYTDRDKIMMIIEPVVLQPLEEEWQSVRNVIAAEMGKVAEAQARRPETQKEAKKVHAAARRAEEAAKRSARKALDGFLERLRKFRVLDPACGSGNFLYLALMGLKDLEHRVRLDAEAVSDGLLGRAAPSLGPECVKGIEINPFAAELARVSVWIGEIQWMKRNGFGAKTNPILDPLDTIECRDAILAADGAMADWPDANVVVGNPPFLGGKLMRTTLGDQYVDQLLSVHRNRVPGEADLVCYWFAKAWERVQARPETLVGLVATNSIRGGANRRVLDRIVEHGAIFEAWDDEPWVVEGAAVRVALVCFAKSAPEGRPMLDGRRVETVYADLTAGESDLTGADRLSENRGVAFMGDTKGGAFDVPGDVARSWLELPLNPNGRPNSDVLRPWVNGMDVTRRPAGKWIIDFGWEMDESEAALYEAPYEYAVSKIKPERTARQGRGYARFWWRHERPRPGMWKSISKLTRFIVTPEVSKHRVFAWLSYPILPDHKLQVISREDDVTFGILISKFHYSWSLRMGSWHGVGNDPRYTIGTTFETFAFPSGLTPDIPASDYDDDPRAIRIATIARRLDELRENWLNPPDLVKREPEVVAGYPDRILPVDEDAAKLLKKRTLTNLYNERPSWLDNIHRELDAAVAAAYGWPEDISDEDALGRLLALNRERKSAEGPP